MKLKHYILICILAVLNTLFYSYLVNFNVTQTIKGGSICLGVWAILTFLMVLTTDNFDPIKLNPYIEIDLNDPPLPQPEKKYNKKGKETWFSQKSQEEWRVYMDRYTELKLKNVSS